MFSGLSDMKKSINASRASESLNHHTHELDPVIFRDKHMLSAIDKTGELDRSLYQSSVDIDHHKKNAFSFMNEHTDLNKMLRPNTEAH